MNCIPESKIEKYILSSIELNKDEIFHILNCDRCRDRYDFFKDLYDKIDFENYIDGLSETKNKAVELKPLKLKKEKNRFTYKLAAQSENDMQKFIVHHFKNENEEIVGRILQEKETNEILIYLV